MPVMSAENSAANLVADVCLIAVILAAVVAGSSGFCSIAAFTTQRYFFAVLFAVLMFLNVTVTTVVPVRNPLP